MWEIVYTKRALRDKQIAVEAGFGEKLNDILSVLAKNPFTPPYEKLRGNFSGAYSRRINIKHRVVYQVYANEKTVKIISMWLHYE